MLAEQSPEKVEFITSAAITKTNKASFAEVLKFVQDLSSR